MVAVPEVEVAALESDRDVEDGEWPEELELLKSNSFTTAVPVIAFLSFTCSLNNTCSTKAPMDLPKFRSIVHIITQLQNQLQKKNITRRTLPSEAAEESSEGIEFLCYNLQNYLD